MERVALAPGLIDEGAEECRLLAGKCASCGAMYFPRREACLECGADRLEAAEIAGRGTLYTFTVVRMPSAHFAAPYAIGWVEFPGGPRVFGQIRARGGEPLSIGMGMAARKGPLWEEDGREVIGYFFEPEAEGGPKAKGGAA
jgi:uncharacterized protein